MNGTMLDTMPADYDYRPARPMLLREDVPAGCSPTGMDRPGGSGIALGLSRTQTVGQHMQASTRCGRSCCMPPRHVVKGIQDVMMSTLLLL